MARKHRADDCMDAGGRAKQGARAENRSAYKIREDWPGRLSGTGHMYRMYCMPISPKAPTFGAGANIGYVQDVRYADIAGANIGDPAIAEKGN